MKHYGQVMDLMGSPIQWTDIDGKQIDNDSHDICRFVFISSLPKYFLIQSFYNVYIYSEAGFAIV